LQDRIDFICGNHSYDRQLNDILIFVVFSGRYEIQ